MTKTKTQIKKSKKIKRKTIKNKNKNKSCEDFCKNDYMVEMKKVMKKSSEKYNIPYISPTKEDDEFTFKTCKKNFCNEKCEGFDFMGNQQQQANFKKKIKNGFQKSYSPKEVEMLKKRGALSGCIHITDYDTFHNNPNSNV